MPVLFLYIVKVSISLAVLYLFYRLVLQHLTFYTLNRWYLLVYSFISFLIPFFNISEVLEQNKWSTLRVVQFVPVINDLSSKPIIVSKVPALSWDAWDYLLIIFCLGITVMIVRFLSQCLSFANIRRKARLLLNEDIKLYEVDRNIIPFSFSRSVFINSQLHKPEELAEILRHEYVHVHQKHTNDIIWAEILCMVNWFNPFAWLIRYSIRQNLEFIADQKVIENGMEKKQYQYLLLKVLGFPRFQMGASFNLSSLKKRINMMNKVRSARAHLVKFLFVLPLLAVLLLAFRITAKRDHTKLDHPYIMVSGLVVQGNSYIPLSHVRFRDSISQVEGSTDDRGFYTLNIPVTKYPYKLNILFSKDGYTSRTSRADIGTRDNPTNVGMVEFMGLNPANADAAISGLFIHSLSLLNKPGARGDYKQVALMFEEVKRSRDKGFILEKQINGSQKPYWVINGHTFLINFSGGVASVDTITDIVFVDGKKMTGNEVNEKFSRDMLNTVGAMEKESAIKKYGINQAVMEILIKGEPPLGPSPQKLAN